MELRYKDKVLLTLMAYLMCPVLAMGCLFIGLELTMQTHVWVYFWFGVAAAVLMLVVATIIIDVIHGVPRRRRRLKHKAHVRMMTRDEARRVVATKEKEI